MSMQSQVAANIPSTDVVVSKGEPQLDTDAFTAESGGDITGSTGRAPSLLVNVLGQRTDVAVYLSPSRVHQVPLDLQPFERLVLCPAYDPTLPTSCIMGERCRLVHADARGLPLVTVHVNYAWRSVDEVTYTRYTAGQALHVAAPNSRVATDVMDSGCVLATRALESKRRPLTHCAHYYYNRQCNLGSECRFVHAVFIDPAATMRRRAPAPVQLGREKVIRRGPRDGNTPSPTATAGSASSSAVSNSSTDNAATLAPASHCRGSSFAAPRETSTLVAAAAA